MIRSNAERSTIRSFTTGNAAARNGSSHSSSPSLKCRMCSWHTVVPRIGPCGTPLIIKPQHPQIPSRQSCSNATGSPPSLINCWFSTSSISRNDMCSLTSCAVYRTILPALRASFCRQMWSVSFIQAASLLVIPLLQVHVLERQRLLVESRLPVLARVFPHRRMAIMLVVPQRLALRRLVLLAEVRPAALLPHPRVPHQQFAQFQEIRHPPGLLQFLVQIIAAARHAHVPPELLADLRNPLERLVQPARIPPHAALVPHHLPQLAVKLVHRLLAFDRQEFLGLLFDAPLCRDALGM